MPYKTGARLKSAASTCEVVVVSAGTSDEPLLCGGAPMSADAAAGDAAVTAADGETVLLGKRYTEANGLEVLCVKPGPGPLTLGATELTLKSAKPLPASD